MSRNTQSPTNGSATRLIFCSESETNNTGYLEFTNSSGVYDPILQAPQVMAHESGQSRMQLGCSLYANQMATKDLLTKGAVREEVHFNLVFSIKRKWPLSTHHQPSCSKSVLGGGVLQDGGTASNEISNITGRLHDDTGPKRCILCTSNSYLPQKVYEVHLSRQNTRVSVRSLWPVHSFSGIH